ncbi:hypothetical protein BG003_009695 [Podila horticola]|nr:hypothetical protein BG003_009695 [Podila horticola]
MKVSNTATFRSNASINNFVQTSGSISATLGLPLMLMSLLVEILLLILSKVSRHDLTSCARISASFNGLTTPLVWRMIRIDSLAQLDCPNTNLKDLGAPRIEYLYTPNIYKARAQLGIYIEEISSYTYPHMCHSTDETLAYAIVHSPRLRRMDLRGCYNASSLTAAAIQSDCEHLEELDLDRCQLPVMEDWASKSLVKFVFMIWVPRLDADVSWIGRREEFAGPTVEHSHNVQRQVYRLLARQTKLEVLDLGHRWSDNDWTVSYPFYQYYSLEMSIESGLEELGVLKEIRELDLRLINHKITVRELEWMVEHWPKLRTVKGLVQEKRSGQNAVLRAWRLNSICIPLLWNTINIQTFDQLRHFHTPAAVYSRHCRHIKDLHLNHEDLFYTFISHGTRSARCTNMRHLTVRSDAELGRPMLYALTQDQENDILALVQQNQSLAAITIKIQMSSESLLILALTSPRSVREMHFSVPLSPQAARFLLDNLPEQVQKLSLHKVYHSEEDAREKLPVMVGGRPRDHHALESLHVFGQFLGLENYIWLPFLTTCGKNFTDLRGEGSDITVLNTPGLLAQLGVFVNELGTCYFPNKEESSDQEIANVISLDSRWTSIDLNNCKYVGPKTVDAILGHCAVLETLHLNRCELLTTVDLNAILGKARKLKDFQTNGIVPRRHDPTPRFLTSTDMAGLRWGSFSIKTFCCPIKVPSPDDDVPAVNREPEWYSTIEDSREAQRQVYQQLSKLTKLSELRLGDMRGGGKSHRAFLCIEYWFQHHQPAWTYK